MNNRYVSLGKYVVHLPHHLLRAKRTQELARVLTDFEFMEVKCSAGMVFELLQDYDKALALKETPSLVEMKKALSLALPSLSDRPDLAIQSIYNRLFWFDPREPELRAGLEATRSELDRRGFWISAEAPLPGSETSATLSIAFGIKSPIQSLSVGGGAIAVATSDGNVEIRDLADNGRLLDSRNLGTSRIVAIALSEGSNSLAFMDADGVIRSEQDGASLAGRRGESVLVYHPLHGVLAVRADHALVSWQPRSGSCTILDTGLPSPLIVLCISPDGDNVLYVAGYNRQTIGIARRTGKSWTARVFPYSGPLVGHLS